MSLALMDSYNPTVQALQRENKKLRAENERLKAELAEAKKDADRYRYFCEHLNDTDQTNPLHILMSAIGSRAPTKQELDAAIDDVIDAMKGK